jgi:aldehyde:ferredoxin oxidoreductase
MSPDNLGPEHYLTLYNLAVGRNLSMPEFIEIGERIHTLQKLVTVKHTRHTREDDVPPGRFFDEPESGVKHKGARLDRAEWANPLDEYYAIDGWDARSTRPRADRLASLGLGEFSALAA